LKIRIITATILILLVVAGMVYLSPLYFSIVFALMGLLMDWEWLQLIGLTNKLLQFFWMIVQIGLMILIYYVSPYFLLSTGLVVWTVLSFWVSYFPKGSRIWRSNIWLRLVTGGAIVLIAWKSVIYIRTHVDGLELLLLMLLIIWSVDSGAYFTGKFCGKRKLAPHISPNKTVEGLLGGGACAIVVTFIYTYSVLPQHFFSPIFVLVCLLAIVMAVIGDLFESIVKRLAGVKDSGHILPGHGGILDRLDSLLAVAPIFAFGISLLDLA